MQPAALMALLLAMLSAGAAKQAADTSSAYKALKCPAPSLGSTWAILDRDGASRQVERYLSSLGSGESGTGMISSPPFIIAVDAIRFTICGHDGQQGGRGENHIALVDARKGQVLVKTPAPQNDAMQERSWDVRGHRGTQVRIEVHDGNRAGGFAWLGVGRIDAGPELSVDFRKGMPAGWAASQRRSQTVAYETLSGGIPFKRLANVFTLVPRGDAVEIPCGFAAKRLFFLGCSAAGARPLGTYGRIEIHYQGGPPDVIPLMGGFTVDAAYKQLSPSKLLNLHASADPYQHYLAIGPRAEPIEKIRLAAQGEIVPRITAITCETDAESQQLTPLPDWKLGAAERAWIEAHSISAGMLNLDQIREAIQAQMDRSADGKRE